MKKIILGFIATLLFIGCSSEEKVAVNVEPALIVGKSLADFKMNDQHEKEQTLHADTKKLIFVFSDDMGHLCNDYFVTKDASYLTDNNTQFVADISAAPSLIQSMFIKPGLEDFKHPVLVLSDKAASAPFRSKMDLEKVAVVYLENKTITDIKTLSTLEALTSTIEAK